MLSCVSAIKGCSGAAAKKAQDDATQALKDAESAKSAADAAAVTANAAVTEATLKKAIQDIADALIAQP